MIVLINSCHGDRQNGRQEVNRETWLAKWHNTQYRFVIGGGYGIQDELIVDEKDDYENMPDKHRAAIRWALGQGYNWVLLTCTDTYVYVPRLNLAEYSRYDYVGYSCPGDRHASGGAGFVLSQRAMKVLADAPLGGTGYGDYWVGRELEKAGIGLHHDGRYWPHGGIEPPPDFITAHLSTATGNFNPQWMRDLHRKVS